jgi:Tfp pilus assembly protein PilN
MKAPTMHLNFAGPKPGPGRAAVVLLLLGGAALLGMLPPWVDALRQEQALALELVRAERPAALAAPKAHDARGLDPRQLRRERALRDATRGLSTPWADLFAALEAAPTGAVALLSIEPSVANRSVRLSAEARDSKAMLAYLAALQHDVRLSQVVLVSHQVQAQTPGTPLRFQIQALWVDAP